MRAGDIFYAQAFDSDLMAEPDRLFVGRTQMPKDRYKITIASVDELPDFICPGHEPESLYASTCVHCHRIIRKLPDKWVLDDPLHAKGVIER